MAKNSKDLLVGKTEIYFNKKDLMALLASATKSNILVVSTKTFACKNDINVSLQAQPMYLNPNTGALTPEIGGRMIIGCSPVPCPYPPGCGGTSNAAAGNITGNALNLDGKKSK